MSHSPEDAKYLARLLEKTPLLPERTLRTHWQRILPWLDVAERYELAAILVDIEHRTLTT